MTTLRNYIGGEWVNAHAADYLELTNPATGESLGRGPLCGTRDVADAVSAAQAAFPKWRETPPVVRARYLFKLKQLMEQHFEDLAATVTRENGKTLDESRGSVRRGIENVEHACGIPTLMMGRTLEDVAAGIDCEYVRQPLGGFAAITPFHFPRHGPMLVLPVRHRHRQHVRAEAERAGAVVTDAAGRACARSGRAAGRAEPGAWRERGGQRTARTSRHRGDLVRGILARRKARLPGGREAR